MLDKVNNSQTEPLSYSYNYEQPPLPKSKEIKMVEELYGESFSIWSIINFLLFVASIASFFKKK